jgi:RNA polymerase primary sigma factor
VAKNKPERSDSPAPAASGTNGRDRKEVQQLIDLGKSKGFLTYEEVNDALPPDVVAADQVEDVMSALGDEDIEIVDAATQVKIAPKRIAEEEALETKKVQVRSDEEESDPYYSKSNDPVRMYLRKMGSVSLLTREGEVEIAKRIEDGEHGVLHAILNSPIAVREIVEIGDKLRKHKIRVKDIIRDAEDDDQEFDEEEADRRIIRLIDKVKRLDKKHMDLLDERKKRIDGKRKPIDRDIQETQSELVQTLEEMRLN